MYEVIALARKDIRLLLRDKAGFFFTFFFPLIYAIFFGVIMSSMNEGPARGIRVAFVDEDATDGSRAFMAALEASKAVEPLRFATGGAAEPATTTTRDRAADLVRQGKAAAFVVLKPGFGAAMRQAFWGEPPVVEVGIDPSRLAEAGMLQGVLTQEAAKRFQSIFTKPDLMREQLQVSIRALDQADDMEPLVRNALRAFLPALDSFLATMPATTQAADGSTSPAADDAFAGFEPITIEKAAVSENDDGPKSAYDISFPQAIAWAVMGCAAGFGISLVTERTSGTLVRLRMSPIPQRSILMGKALACFITTLTVMLFLLLMGIFVFGVRPDSIWLLGCAMVCVAIAFVGIMMLLSVMGRTEQSAGGIGWAVLLGMAMIGGGMIPLFAMPRVLQTLSHVSPVKWAILSLEGAIWRGFSPTEMILPCAILIGVGVLCFLIGVRAFRWTDSNA